MEATESPLDVLSRAATMVQDNSAEYDSRDAGRLSTLRSHAGDSRKDLPSVRWRRERRGRDRLPEYSKQQDKGDTPSPPPPPEILSSRTGLVTGDIPLDMSTRTRGLPPSYSQSISAPGYRGITRPSVITCAPSTNSSSSGSSQQGRRRELLSGMCDPVIDEHFRRSLGEDYMNLFSSDCNINNNNNCENGTTITVTGLSVDDHFAKALGDTWVKLQEQQNGQPSTNPSTNKEKKPPVVPRRGVVTI